MKSKTLILMVVAIVCGLAASYMTSRVIAERSNKDGEQEKVTVLVARQNLPMGTVLKDPEKLFEEKNFLKGEEPKKAVRTFDVLKSRQLNKPLSAEQFVTTDDITDKDLGGLAATMKKGMRAVGLKVTLENISGGFVLPHSHVDIVSVVRRSDTETYAKILLQNVLVLAVDTFDVRPEDKHNINATTVTVQVTPEQAEKLSLATELGSLRLILRSWDDDKSVQTHGVTPKNMTQGSDKSPEDSLASNDEGSRSRKPTWGPKVPDVPSQPATRTPDPVAPKVFVMRVYNGESLTTATYTEGEEANVRIEKTQSDKAPVSKTPRPAPKP